MNKENKKKIVVVIAMIIICCIVILMCSRVLYYFLSKSSDTEFPSEELLIERFKTNKEKFQFIEDKSLKYREMTISGWEDTDLSQDESFYSYLLSKGVTAEEIEEYKNTLYSLDLNTPYGFHKDLEGDFHFITDTSGISVSGSEIGYALFLYTPQSYIWTGEGKCEVESKVVESLYNPITNCDSFSGDRYIYRRISDHWYLYLSET